MSALSKSMTTCPKKEAKDPVPPLGQCGLENDARMWVRSKGPQRIRVSGASPEMTAKCRALLDRIFAEPKRTIIGHRIPFHPDEVLEICQEVLPYLKSEPVFIEDITHHITIVGALH
ncbi:hypothetical protein PENTCL1PPCAC_8833 [Pristionchus entomophagus]|uniref:Uncharacterized protein n=1 Tax=Pristionchus entomophagus TaxID=358040 RepID=A0AAV5SU65_9BILA|nr:hypothetical protein PENTCL1PPCAC_8833 [Pristionchus entomophagus]